MRGAEDGREGARASLERALGVEVDPRLRVRVHVFAADAVDDEVDYEVVYAVVEASADEARALQAAAGLASAASDAMARVLLVSGWTVDPGEAPDWWPADPEALGERAARGREPAGWIVSGYADGRLFVLATRTPAAAPGRDGPPGGTQETTVT